MIKKDGVLIMKWGLDSNSNLYKEQKVDFPDSCPITVNFDDNEIVGSAKNFRQDSQGIWCDVIIDETISETLAPKFVVDKVVDNKTDKEISGIHMLNVSCVVDGNHAVKDLNYNCADKCPECGFKVRTYKSGKKKARHKFGCKNSEKE